MTPFPAWCECDVARAGSSRVRLLFTALGLGGTMLAAPVMAQESAETRLFLLDTPASVRSAGLNGAGAALVGYAGAVFTNPAGLATIRHIGLEGGYRTAALNGYIATGALGWRLRQFDLGVGFQYYDLEDFALAAPAPAANRYEFLGVGSLVYRYGLIAIGASAKTARQSLAGEPVRGVSGDIGLTIAVFDIMAIGFAVQNVSGNWERNSPLAMPRLSRFGFTMNYVDPQETFRLLSTLEVQWPAGQDSRFVLGGEGGVVIGGVGVIGRVAHGSQPEGSDRSRFSFGATLELGFRCAGSDCGWRCEIREGACRR